MQKYYSQRGEDYLLDKIFSDKRNGFFVEVGCIDGKRFSNTLFFENKGWKGICVEAHADYIELIKKNRPACTVIHAAVGEKDEKNVTFYANARGSLSSLDQSTEERWRRDYAEYFTGFTEQIVDKKTLNTIFKENKVERIDILSIDIEGYEVEALIGLDLAIYRPRIIIVESDSKEHFLRINKILLPYGYKLITRLRDNLFYSTDKKDRSIINNKLFTNIELVRSEDPSDNKPDEKEVVNIDTRRKWLKKILRRCKSIVNKIIGQFRKTERGKFFDIGFHGDLHLIKVVFAMIKKSEQFIETGSNVGSTLCYVAKNFPKLDIISCEPNKTAFNEAYGKVAEYKNATVKKEFSPDFLFNLEKTSLGKDTVFWLDSHGSGFEWPLKKEIEFITQNFKSGYIFIDDFKVPGQAQFGFDQYNGQVCGWDYIAHSLSKENKYNVSYPKYFEKTSNHHPLRGWVLIEFGHKEKINFSDDIKDLIFIKND